MSSLATVEIFVSNGTWHCHWSVVAAGNVTVKSFPLIDTAGSAHAGAKALKANGAKRVSIACSHGVFSDPASERLLDGTFDEIVTTDSIPLNGKMKESKIVKVLSLAPVIAKVIENIESGTPVSQVYSLFQVE